jgi:hypothetical protein
VVEGNRTALVLSATGPRSITVAACDARAVCIEVELDTTRWSLTGPPGRVVVLARGVLDAVVAASDAIGQRCVFCRRRGLNDGAFAADHDGAVAHLGCLQDYRHRHGGATWGWRRWPTW